MIHHDDSCPMIMMDFFSIHRNTYADGRWYKVKMIRTSINATLSVSMVGSTNPVHTENINVFAQTTLPEGSQIVFGAPPSSKYAFSTALNFSFIYFFFFPPFIYSSSSF